MPITIFIAIFKKYIKSLTQNSFLSLFLWTEKIKEKQRESSVKQKYVE